MNRVRVSISSVCAVFLVAACSGSDPTTGSGQGGSGGGSGAQTGGTGTPGGTTSGSLGGSNAVGGTNAGNTGGVNSGNTGGVDSGNTGGVNSGNTGGVDSGNTGGVNSGNTGGINSGNTGGTNSGNTGGKTGTGGTNAGATGGTVITTTGGKTGTGGTNAGATGGAATGGAATGGSTAATGPTCVTSAQGAYWQTATVTTVTSGTADVTVNDATTNQTWEGLGGSFNEMGWNQLSTTALQTQAIQALFGVDGAHFVLGRIPIGASDYAMNRYTLDDATGSPGNDPTAATGEANRPAADASMANFSITRDTQKLIPYIQAALAVNPNIRLWASPWTPPVWMKTGYKTASGAPSGGNAVRPSYFDGGNMKSDTTTLNAYAQYLVKWIQAYKAQGITVETVSAQNEPGYDQNYPSCLWSASTYTSFIKILGPALTAASLTTKVMGGTMSNPNDSSILSSVMGDATAKTYIKVVGVQWGMLDSAVSSPSTFSAYGVPLWATEHKCGNYPWDTGTYKSTAPNDQAYGVESWGYIRDAITKAKVTAYNAWNMVLDNVGLGIDTSRTWAQDSLLTVSGGNLNKTPAYYVFSHIGHFVDAGAKVVGTTGGDAIGFKNPDNSIVAVVYNSGAAKTSIVTIGGTKYQFSMPSNGWATIKK